LGSCQRESYGQAARLSFFQATAVPGLVQASRLYLRSSRDVISDTLFLDVACGAVGGVFLSWRHGRQAVSLKERSAGRAERRRKRCARVQKGPGCAAGAQAEPAKALREDACVVNDAVRLRMQANRRRTERLSCPWRGEHRSIRPPSPDSPGNPPHDRMTIPMRPPSGTSQPSGFTSRVIEHRLEVRRNLLFPVGAEQLKRPLQQSHINNNGSRFRPAVALPRIPVSGVGLVRLASGNRDAVNFVADRE